MPTKGDDFSSGTDAQNLSARTPTGPNAGTSWAVHQAGSVVVYRLGTVRAEENNFSSGNRYRLTDSIASYMTVEADVGFVGSAAGDIVFAGVLGRVESALGGTNWEFIFDRSIPDQWILSDGTTTTTFSEGWLGGTVTFKLLIKPGRVEGYANGVLKVSLDLDTLGSNTRAGLVLGNFKGAGSPANFCTRFVASPSLPDPILFAQAIF